MALTSMDMGLRDSSLHNVRTILHVYGNGIAKYAKFSERRRPLSVVALAQGGQQMRPPQPNGELRVPSSKELQKMRQFRQQQLFRQQQQLRNVQRLAPAPGVVPDQGAPKKGDQARSRSGPKKGTSEAPAHSKRSKSPSAR